MNITSITSIIFYGAGEWASLNGTFLINRLENHLNSDVKLLCFADKNTQKHYTRISLENGEDFLILPLKDAIAKFPNAKIVITSNPSIQNEISNELISTGLITKEQILPFIDNITMVRGCSEMHKRIMLAENSLFYCCAGFKNMEHSKFDLTNYEKSIDNFITLRQNAINSINT